MRTRLMARYLSEHGYETWVLSPARENMDTKNGAIRYVTFRWPIYDRLMARLKAAFAKVQGGSSLAAEARLIHAFGSTRRNRTFKAHATEMLRGSSVGFIEYPMWSGSLIPLCRLLGIPSVLTAYDIHSDVIGSHPTKRNKLLQLELEALRSADFAFCVSAADQEFVARFGIGAGCITNPIDIQQCYASTDPQVIEKFRHSHHLDDRPICAFVGSAHLPNVEAAKTLERLGPLCPEAQFVVAGLCAPRDISGAVKKLGMIGPEDLRVLYSSAKLVVIPLDSGTGTSLKTIEAFAYCKPVLASNIAVRGYNVVPGRDALIEDDFMSYPTIIRSMLANSDQRRKLSQDARTLAEKYDYRNVFKGYDHILESVRSQDNAISVDQKAHARV